MDAPASKIKASSSARFETLGKVEMHKDQQISFICPNFATDYIPGVLKLPCGLCVESGHTIPERVLLHVPPGVVWKGVYRKDRSCIEGLEKLMSSYCIKPYHMVLFKYRGGQSFYLNIFNPYGVEISYHIENRTHLGVEIDKKLLTTSEFENEKLCGTLSFNAYESGKGICDVVLQRRHLIESGRYDVLEKSVQESLGLVESMECVKLSYKDQRWEVKLYWQHGKVYMSRNWYRFARAGNLREGDTISFQKTEEAQTYIICVFEKDLLGKCNVAGVGHTNGIMDWFKIANLEFLSSGEMEIPRVFKQIPGLRLAQSVSLVFPDGETVVVNYSSERNMLCGMTKMIKKYSIRATDVMIFSLSNECTFVVSMFKISGMESKYILANNDEPQALGTIAGEDIINVFEGSNQALVEAPQYHVPGVPDNGEMEVGVPPDDLVNFTVILKPSHVDRRQHGVYLPASLYPYYKNWTTSTVIRLVCGANISLVSMLRSAKRCRLGKGWSEFTKANNLQEGQILRLSYVEELTFHITIVH